MKLTEVRYLPKEYTATTITLCYNNTTLNLIWEPEMIAIMIKSKQIAEDYKKQLKFLWKICHQSQ